MKRRSALIATGAVAGAAAVAAAGTAVAAGRRWRAAEDPCAGTVLDLQRAERFEVERPDGAVLHGVVVGEGPLVVLSHCWTGNRNTWDPVAARLVARGRRVVLYDQRGHGASSLGPEAPTVERLGEDLAAVLEAVDAHDAVVVGHSMGGMAVQAMAVARPDLVAKRVRALVLAGTAAARVAAGPLTAPVRLVTGHPGVERLVAGRAGPALCRGVVGRRPVQAHLVASRDAFLSLPTAVRSQFLLGMQAMDLRPGLGGVDVPTTVVVGRRDILTPPRLARVIAAGIPGARLVEVPGAGHMLPWEEPDLLTDLIVSAGKGAGT